MPTKEMAEYCFDVVLAKLEHKNIPSFPAIISTDKWYVFAPVLPMAVVISRPPGENYPYGI